MVQYTLDKINKHSVRYKQKDKTKGPVTIYVPNEFFEDMNNPPAILHMDLRGPK